MIEPIPSDAVKNYEHIVLVNKINEIVGAVNKCLTYLALDSRSHSLEYTDIDISELKSEEK